MKDYRVMDAQQMSAQLLEMAELAPTPDLQECYQRAAALLDHPAQQTRSTWEIQASVPSDGFNCYYLLRDGITVAEVNGFQNDQRSRHLADLVNAANAAPPAPYQGSGPDYAEALRLIRKHRQPGDTIGMMFIRVAKALEAETEAGEVCDGCGKLLICRSCGKFRSAEASTSHSGQKMEDIEAALRDAFPHFQNGEAITPEAIKRVGKEWQDMVVNWAPQQPKIIFLDQDGHPREIEFEIYDHSSAWVIPETADWVATSSPSPGASVGKEGQQ